MPTEPNPPDEPSPGTFNEAIYRAAYIIDPASVSDDDDFWEYNTIDALGRLNTPGRALEEAAIDSGYDTGAAIWQGFKLAMDTIDNPSTMLLYDMNQKDVYMAILLKAFQSAIESSAKAQADDFMKNVTSFSNTVMEGVKSIHNIELQDADAFKKLDDPSIAKVNQVVKEQFEKEYTDFALSEDMLESCTKLANYCGDFLTYCENIFSYINLYRMSDTMKEVLYEMRAQVAADDSQEYLTAALDDCIAIISNTPESFVNNMIEHGILVAGKRCLEDLAGKYWGKLMVSIKANYPAVGSLLAGAKAGMLISEYLFNSSAASGKYFEMTAVTEIEAIADKVLRVFDKRFLSSRTEFNGQAYIDAIQVRYHLLDHECSAAYGFSTLIDSGAYVQFMKNLGLDSPSEVPSTILKLQEGYITDLDTINTKWILSLYERYPELYEKYVGRFNTNPQGHLKAYTIACPVDVYVYDTNGTLVAAVEDERITASGNVSISVENRTKELYLYDDAQYEIVCVGYDAGTMDITIQEFSDGVQIRRAEFYDIPLEEDTAYHMTTKDDPADQVVYQITDPNESPIEADFDSNLSAEATYRIKVINGYVETNEGMMPQRNLYNQESCQISAYAPKNHAFVRWEVTEGHCEIEDTYAPNTRIIMGNEDVVLTAVFELVNPFTDVPPDSFYYVPVLWALENNITTGATETTYNPNGACLRAQVVTFLHRAAGSPASTSNRNPFTDVKTADFFYAPVLWAVEKGITNGVSADKFGSYDVCNRAAVVTFLWRAAGSPEPESTSHPFVDVKPGDFFYKPVLWAVENGITNGIDDTHFGPTSPCNRAQVVTFLYRAYN